VAHAHQSDWNQEPERFTWKLLCSKRLPGNNPEFGSKEDLKELVKKAHDLGLHVIIDWVANHTSWDNNLITEHPDWFKHDSTGKIIPPVADWTDVAGLNYEKKELREKVAILKKLNPTAMAVSIADEDSMEKIKKILNKIQKEKMVKVKKA